MGLKESFRLMYSNTHLKSCETLPLRTMTAIFLRKPQIMYHIPGREGEPPEPVLWEGRGEEGDHEADGCHQQEGEGGKVEVVEPVHHSHNKLRPEARSSVRKGSYLQNKNQVATNWPNCVSSAHSHSLEKCVNFVAIYTILAT